MHLFGLSSLDGLLSLLLVDLTWWGFVFIGQFVPYFVELVFEYLESSNHNEHQTRHRRMMEREPWHEMKHHSLEGSIQYGLTNLTILSGSSDLDLQIQPISTLELKLLIGFGVLLFLRLKAPLFLLIIVLKNRVNEHCQLLKIWYWIGIILDIVIVAYTFLWKFNIANILCICLPFLILRIISWSVGNSIVNELSVKESSLFPIPGCKGVFRYLAANTRNAISILITWEILSNILQLLSSILLYVATGVFDMEVSFMLPIAYPIHTLDYGYYGLFFCWAINIVAIVVSSLTLLSVHKNSRSAMKFLVVLYLITGLIGYLTLEAFSLLETWKFQKMKETSGMENLFWVGAILALPMIITTILLKIFLIEYIVKFCNESGKPYEIQENEASLQPLLLKLSDNEKQSQ